MPSSSELKTAKALFAQRICKVAGGPSAFRRGRLAAILRGANLLPAIQHPTSFLEVAPILVDPQSELRVDLGYGPKILVRDFETQEIQAYKAVDLLFSDDLSFRSAGFDQIHRSVTRFAVLRETIAKIRRLSEVLPGSGREYWTNLIEMYDALNEDPFWRAAGLHQMAEIGAHADVQSELGSLVASITVRPDLLTIAEEAAPVLFLLRNDGTDYPLSLSFPSWRFLESKQQSPHTALGPVDNPKLSGPWKSIGLLLLEISESETTQSLDPAIDDKNVYAQMELCLARIFSYEYFNRYGAAKTEDVIRIAWALAVECMFAIGNMPQNSIEVILKRFQDLESLKHQAFLLCPSPPRLGIEYFLTFCVDRPWSIAALLLTNGIPKESSRADHEFDNWSKGISESLSLACIMELKAGRLRFREGGPQSIAELALKVGEQLDDEKLQGIAGHSLELAEVFDKTDSILSLFDNNTAVDPTHDLVVLGRLSEKRPDDEHECRELLKVVCSGNWLKSRLDALPQDNRVPFLEAFVLAFADPNIDADRQVSATICNLALSDSEDEVYTAQITTIAVISAIRENAPNVTALLTSRSTPHAIRNAAQGILMKLNESYNQIPENVRSRIRPHLQYIGWTHE